MKIYPGIGQCFALAICCLFPLIAGCSNSAEKPEGTSGVAKSASSDLENTTENSTNAKKESATEPVSVNTSSQPDAPKPEKDTPKKIKVSTEPDINEPEFHEALLAASEDYLRYGMVNSIALAAPEECRADDATAPKPLMSESDHESSHGKKLYFLFAKEIGHYVNPEGKPAPVGQVVVKESWTSSPSNPAARNLINHASGNRVNPRAKVGDKTLEIGQRKNFFVMTKLAEDTPKTDQGWVYGVVDSDTRKVIASGKVASCMSCHVEGETNDRLFGSKLFSFEETIVSEVEMPAPDSKQKAAPKKKDAPKKAAPKKDAEKKPSKGSESKKEATD